MGSENMSLRIRGAQLAALEAEVVKRFRAEVAGALVELLPDDAACLEETYLSEQRRPTERGGAAVDPDDSAGDSATGSPQPGLAGFLDDLFEASDELELDDRKAIAFFVLSLATMERLESQDPDVFAYAAKAWNREGEPGTFRLAVLERYLKARGERSPVASELLRLLNAVRERF
jgi:hypothetical protein